MRGAVSLAVALALPLSTDAGATFPQRDLIIFLTFAVIFFTLVVQGLSLPALLRRLAVTRGAEEADEELRARLVATEAALVQLDAIADEPWTREDTIDRQRRFFEYRKRRYAARAGEIEDDEGYEDRSLAYQQLLQAVLGAQREALVGLRNQGKISNDVMYRVVRALDLEESRLEI
jgi:CPA1 family monovalent cation:H+ antiporter